MNGFVIMKIKKNNKKKNLQELQTIRDYRQTGNNEYCNFPPLCYMLHCNWVVCSLCLHGHLHLHFI